MIINKLDLVGVPIFPPRADSPLVIDTNTVLAGAIAFELLQAVAGRDAEILELLGGVNDTELPEHQPMELGGEAPDAFTPEEPLRVPIGEAGDHPT